MAELPTLAADEDRDARVPAPAPAAPTRRAARIAHAVQAVGTGEVDALFVADGAGRRLITLNGADRAYRLLVEDMAEGALTLTPDAVVAWCNRSFAALLQRPLNRLIGTPIDLCFAPEGRAALATLLAEGHRGRRSLAIDLLTDLGHRVPTYLTVNPSVVDGLPEALCMVVTDLTEQKRSEAERLSRRHLLEVIEEQQRTQRALQDSLAALRLRNRALGAVSQGVLITDAQRRVTYVNAAFEAMSGYAAAELAGQSCSLLQGPQTDPVQVQAMRSALDAGTPFHGEVPNYRKDGVPFWNDLSITPVLGVGGEPTQFVGVQRDITEPKRAEQTRLLLESQLREAQKMEAIGTLAGGIANDFNNILGSMLGNLGPARHTLAAGHAAQALLAQVSLAGERARNLVQQILAFSRRQPTLLRAQPLQTMVREAVHMLRATLPATVRLELEVAPGPQPLILADATQLEQIVINLCTNAWQALSGSTGHIAVSIDAVQVDAGHGNAGEGAAAALPPGHYARLRVSDTGHGMDGATRARIFEPFFSTKTPGQGTGLGLSVVHGIVASHCGHIAVHSRPGGGTIFELHFPVVQAQPSDVTVPAAPDDAVRGRGQRVLVIDDDEVMLVMVGHLLESLGYEASCFADPVAAIASVRADARGFDAVLSDYNMPPMSGLDVARALQAIDAELPVVISSGFISDGLREAAAALGVVELMRKEHTLDELGALLGRLLAPRPPRRGH